MRNSLPHARRFLPSALTMTLALLAAAVAARAESPRVLPDGELPHDERLGRLTDLNKDYFPFSPCTSPESWAKRAERVRRQVLVATGMWPVPTKTPANAVIHTAVDRDQYTVEKVYLESFLGHYVTGNLYRPKGRSGRLPAVLCPHGHWRSGRFCDAGEKAVKEQIAQGAEKYEVGGRYPLQARCVQLARMGCVVFHYDMVGYADSVQLAHGPGVRSEMNTPQDWGYFSPQAEGRLQNMMGLQTYNSTRALDFLSGLPDVDPGRIAVTGASGGGTQTFILCSIDSRPAVAFPAVMVSTAMQGGCTCENACYLRIGAGNVEIAALFSPRPLGMTAANDWTKEMTTKGFPELGQHYRMLGVPDLVMLESLTQFGHNYNYPSRAAMYGWLNKHLKLGLHEPIVETDFEPLSIDEMTVWDEQHPKPSGGNAHERALLRWITEDSEKQMAALIPSNQESLARYREIVGGAVDVMIGRGLTDPQSLELARVRTKPTAGFEEISALLRSPQQEEEIPIICLRPADPANRNGQAVIWIAKSGKQAMFAPDGRPEAAIARLLEAGMTVVGVDLFGQGEFVAENEPIPEHRRVGDRYAGYVFGYNHPPFCQRVHDILTVISHLRGSESVAGERPRSKIHLVGLNGAGHWVAAARAQAGAAVDRVVVDTDGFRFAILDDVDHPDFLPGGAKYRDLPGIVALSAPSPLWLAGEDATPPEVAAAYRAAGHAERVTVFTRKEQDKEIAAVEWLLQ